MTTINILGNATAIDTRKGFTVTKGKTAHKFATYADATAYLNAHGGCLSYFIAKDTDDADTSVVAEDAEVECYYGSDRWLEDGYEASHIFE